jgi:hypothetical protein
MTLADSDARWQDDLAVDVGDVLGHDLSRYQFLDFD